MDSLGLVALLISFATLLLSLGNFWFKARKDYVREVEARVEQLEADLRACQAECERMQRENLTLMRRFFRERPDP